MDFQTTTINPLTPMSDQDRISPSQHQYNLKKTSNENIEKYPSTYF